MRSNSRSAIFAYGQDQLAKAEASRDAWQVSLTQRGKEQIVTEILPADEFPFYPAQRQHQQYPARR